MFLFLRFPSLFYTFELAISLYFLFVLISFISSSCTFLPIIVDRECSIDIINYGESKKHLKKKRHPVDDLKKRPKKEPSSSTAKGYESRSASKPFVKEAHDESNVPTTDVPSTDTPKAPSPEATKTLQPSNNDLSKLGKLSPVVEPLVAEESPKKSGSKTSQKKSITKEGSKTKERKTNSKSLSNEGSTPSSPTKGHKSPEKKNSVKEERQPSQKKSDSKENNAKKEVSPKSEADGNVKQEVSNTSTLVKGENDKKESSAVKVASVEKLENKREANLLDDGRKMSTNSFNKEASVTKVDSTKLKSSPEVDVKKLAGSSVILKKEETKKSSVEDTSKSVRSSGEFTKNEFKKPSQSKQGSKSSELAKQSFSGESKKSITTILGERKSLASELSKSASPQKITLKQLNSHSNHKKAPSKTNVTEASRKSSLVESITSQLKFTGTSGALYGLALPNDNISENLKLVKSKLIQLVNSNMLQSTNTPIHNEHY